MKTLIINVSDKRATFLTKLIRELGLDPMVADTEIIKQQFVKFAGSLPKVELSDEEIIAEIDEVRKNKKGK